MDTCRITSGVSYYRKALTKASISAPNPTAGALLATLFTPLTLLELGEVVKAASAEVDELVGKELSGLPGIPVLEDWGVVVVASELSVGAGWAGTGSAAPG